MVIKEFGNSIVFLFKMISIRVVSGFYRVIIEMYVFYRCDIVISVVMM